MTGRQKPTHTTRHSPGTYEIPEDQIPEDMGCESQAGFGGFHSADWSTEDWEKWARGLAERAAQEVQQKPLQSLGIAFGTGVAAGALLMMVTRPR